MMVPLRIAQIEKANDSTPVPARFEKFKESDVDLEKDNISPILQNSSS